MKIDKNEIEEIKVEANRCLSCKNSTCQKACPLNTNISKMISKVKEENFEEAYEVILETNPLGLICGLVCPYEKQCEGACIRGIKGEPVQIGKIESFVCENYGTQITLFGKEKSIKKDLDQIKDKENLKDRKKTKVAIVGGGPAGISCAYFLSTRNISSTIFEKGNYLGGILKYGIPNFRLDKELVEKTIDNCLNYNIELKLNHILVSSDYKKQNKVEDGKEFITIDELKERGYDYIFLCFGNEKSKSLQIEGIEQNNVIGANEFLKINSNYLNDNASKNDIDRVKIYNDKEFVIIGGGNVAIDSARVAKRLGKTSTIIYRRLEENMPANRSEIEEAKQEGINFIFQKNVTKVEREDERLKLTLDDNSIFKTDFLIQAIGSNINKNSLENNIAMNENELIDADNNHETNIKNVFAGGDLIQNKSSVAWAIRNGRDVANEIAKRIEEQQ